VPHYCPVAGGKPGILGMLGCKAPSAVEIDAFNRAFAQCMLLFLNRRLARGIAEIIAVDDGKRVQNLANNRANIERALGESLAAAVACGESGTAAGSGAGARAESSEVPMPWDSDSEVQAWDGALEAFEGEALERHQEPLRSPSNG
jgi:hypothetical protein